MELWFLFFHIDILNVNDSDAAVGVIVVVQTEEPLNKSAY